MDVQTAGTNYGGLLCKSPALAVTFPESITCNAFVLNCKQGILKAILPEFVGLWGKIPVTVVFWILRTEIWRAVLLPLSD